MKLKSTLQKLMDKVSVGYGLLIIVVLIYAIAAIMSMISAPVR